ncbi:zinc-binding dehydrogenase [Nocardia farcinica]|uniref:zinc-binding dehydrogenase n=1 Tax=Nocardia farcinica TaxID=37329 RepID=UPI00189480AF|nr:zinc-binding dehydrogenase [Nocardia farcinica]MBF6266465.1 zinc-binding dehydrogenase [Nocardia farcinica]MCZ9325209.1 zinc-binding dehydrogenase [Nocardia farcinica]
MDSLPGGVTRAAVWTGAGVAVRDVPVPRLAPGQSLVRVRLATVCGSDLHTVAGRRAAPCPSVLGHEAVGEIVATTPRAGHGAPGQRVVWSVTAACGRCARCRAGRTAKCLSVRKVGHEAFDGDWPLSGSYARHLVLPAGVRTVAVPDTVPDAVAAPAACATATVMAALEAAGDLAGRRVLVYGAGMLGLTAAAACAHRGAHVAVRDVVAARAALAAGFGGGADDGLPVDAAFDFSGSSAAIADALTRLDIGGALVLAGSVAPGPPVPLDAERVVRRWLRIAGVHNYEPRHLTDAVDFLAATVGTYPWHELVAEPLPLDDIAAALTGPPAGRTRCAVAP